MVVDGRSESDGRLSRTSHSRRLVFQCHGCASRFTGDPAGPGVCPRCSAIGGHDRFGRAAETAKDE